jgi:hypothetical protein
MRPGIFFIFAYKRNAPQGKPWTQISQRIAVNLIKPPHPPSPSPGGEGVKGVRLFKIDYVAKNYIYGIAGFRRGTGQTAIE